MSRELCRPVVVTLSLLNNVKLTQFCYLFWKQAPTNNFDRHFTSTLTPALPAHPSPPVTSVAVENLYILKSYWSSCALTSPLEATAEVCCSCSPTPSLACPAAPRWSLDRVYVADFLYLCYLTVFSWTTTFIFIYLFFISLFVLNLWFCLPNLRISSCARSCARLYLSKVGSHRGSTLGTTNVGAKLSAKPSGKCWDFS